MLKNSLLSVFVFACTTVSAQDLLIPYCPVEVVDQAAADGFIQFVLQNCISDAGSPPHNKLGNTPLGPYDCLTMFIYENQPAGTENAIPATGSCRRVYQGMISEMVSSSTDITNYCSYNESTKTVDIGFMCASVFNIPSMDFLTLNNVGVMGTAGQCSTAVVFDRAVSLNAYPALMELAQTTGVPPVAFQSVTDGLCDMCYVGFLDNVNQGFNDFQTDLKVDCADDITSDNCRESATLFHAFEQFQVCSGHHIEFTGPLCTSANEQSLTSIKPNPFFGLTVCALVDMPYCAPFDEYMQLIVSSSDENCGDCFDKYYTTVSGLGESDSEIATACVGDISSSDAETQSALRSDECKAKLATALFSFKVCAGFDLANLLDSQ